MKTDEMIADSLTKAVGKQKFYSFIDQIGLVDDYVATLGGALKELKFIFNNMVDVYDKTHTTTQSGVDECSLE